MNAGGDVELISEGEASLHRVAVRLRRIRTASARGAHRKVSDAGEGRARNDKSGGSANAGLCAEGIGPKGRSGKREGDSRRTARASGLERGRRGGRLDHVE